MILFGQVHDIHTALLICKGLRLGMPDSPGRDLLIRVEFRLLERWQALEVASRLGRAS